ncbi:alpha/beta fold hydrolase [Pusillimonas noertemannii]|uniref:Pimeloyl-ACP methyl ester carboxylesterase n=1 Tax=Pusillimonas noertemannii TaxID=305977 RepID=A0A2U1CNG4_9BURK|nr:alpha/beta hydrolase [Pusillimonas noertemannii]NYT68428.1 alpha/beta fold hydrolase [Pusillimonas noertemannii]PVY62555.1 pimeloyl-ACP methyl ester carboxylesterase [Pusillimonas noertemannii]TFL10494.1 alpha/beta fold hydrolase [Pusillimonas noertemannii]
MTEAIGKHIALPGDQGELWVEVAGAGDPLVFIHGFGLDAAMWDKQFAHFSRTHRTIRYEMRGFGRSSRPVGPYDHVEDLQHLLAHMGIRSADFIGLSLGANVALNLARVHPQAVRALVAASPGLPGHAWNEERPPEAAQAYARSHGVEATRRFWFEHPLFAGSRSRPDARDDLWSAIQRYDGWHWTHENPMRPFSLTAAHLAEIKAPCLILSGGLDVAGYRDIARTIAAGVPSAMLVEFSDAGHMVNLDDPARFNHEVQRFLEKSQQDAEG